METDREVVARFKEWRSENGLPFNANFLPLKFESMKDLEDDYWKAEQAALDFERERDAKKALPPARPRRKPQRAVTTRKNGDLGIKLEAYVTGSDLKAFGQFLKAEMEEFAKSTQAALNKRLLWRGTWRTGESYAANDLVQDRGTIFVCNAAKSEARPGTGSGWRMLVKAGAAK